MRLIWMEFLNQVSGPLSKISSNMLVRSAKTTQSRVDTTWVLFCNLSFSLRRKQVFLGLCYEGSVHFQGLSNGPCVLGCVFEFERSSALPLSPNPLKNMCVTSCSKKSNVR